MSVEIETVKDVIAGIIEVEADELGDDDSLPEKHDVDSLLGLEILVALEKKFKVKIPESMLREMTTVRKIAAELNSKLAAKT
jgi:acyl carrier protein